MSQEANTIYLLVRISDTTIRGVIQHRELFMWLFVARSQEAAKMSILFVDAVSYQSICLSVGVSIHMPLDIETWVR